MMNYKSNDTKKSSYVVIISLLFIWAFSRGPVETAVASTTIVVNNTADVINPDDGFCTLREAITSANTNTPSGTEPGECPAGTGDDVIMLPAGVYTLSIAGPDDDDNLSGDLDITSNLTINGSGAADTIIDANGLDRVLHIMGEVTVTINDVTIANGSVTGPGGGHPSGIGGGIYSQWANLTLNHVIVRDNSATTDVGGGIVNEDGTLTINNSAIYGNTTEFSGGGIVNWSRQDRATTAHINNTTISDNAAGHVGAGIANATDPFATADATVTLNNSTVTQNEAGLDSSGADKNGGGVASQTFGTEGGVAALYIQNSIVIGNLGPFVDTADCYDTVFTNGHNLVGDGTGCPLGTNDVTITDPNLHLSPNLDDNDGPTPTHALPAGSLAIGNGDNATCETTDQRGVPRPQNVTCDSGGFEYADPAAIGLQTAVTGSSGNWPTTGIAVLLLGLMGCGLLVRRYS